MKTRILAGLIILVAAALVAGCGGSGSSAVGNQNQTSAPRIVSVSPADGAAQVATGSPVIVTFSQPMNMGSVQNNFHVYQGTNATGTSMMGNESWNDMQTTMTFMHDQGFASGATYTVHFGQGMMGNAGGMMMNMSGQMMNQDVDMYFHVQ